MVRGSSLATSSPQGALYSEWSLPLQKKKKISLKKNDEKLRKLERLTQKMKQLDDESTWDEICPD